MRGTALTAPSTTTAHFRPRGLFTILPRYEITGHARTRRKTKKKNHEFPNIRYSEHEGLKTTQDFLIESKNYLTNDGEILLGINTFYVSQTLCNQLISETGYRVEKITKMKFNTSIVFRLKSFRY